MAQAKKKNKNFWGKTTSPLKKDHNIGGNKVNNNGMYQVAKWSDAYFLHRSKVSKQRSRYNQPMTFNSAYALQYQ